MKSEQAGVEVLDAYFLAVRNVKELEGLLQGTELVLDCETDNLQLLDVLYTLFLADFCQSVVKLQLVVVAQLGLAYHYELFLEVLGERCQVIHHFGHVVGDILILANDVGHVDDGFHQRDDFLQIDVYLVILVPAEL